MAKATERIITSKDWQTRFKVPKVIKRGDKLPDELNELISHNSPHLSDDFKIASNRQALPIKDAVKEVNVPKAEEVKPKKKKKGAV